jgi:hypothetical protein
VRNFLVANSSWLSPYLVKEKRKPDFSTLLTISFGIQTLVGKRIEILIPSLSFIDYLDVHTN